MPLEALLKLSALEVSLNKIDNSIADIRRSARADGMGKSEFVQKELHALYAQRKEVLANVRNVATHYGIAMV